MIEYKLRAVDAQDEPFLWQMLYYAAHVHEQAEKTLTDVQADPALALYVSGWGRPGDLGFIAEESSKLTLLGAVWVRLYVGANKAYSQTDDQTPELAIAVHPGYIGQGIGTALMNAIIQAGSLHFPAIALNVRADNPACRLYQRLGFAITGELILTKPTGSDIWKVETPTNISNQTIYVEWTYRSDDIGVLDLEFDPTGNFSGSGSLAEPRGRHAWRSSVVRRSPSSCRT